ncbi:MAG: glycoside hydrolase family 127 protein [Pirellulales bacterium]|nr:glycoside hydrolase family 127 protein [Pirellulales bacterium]
MPQEKGNRLVEDFDYRGVTLDGGLMRTQLDEMREYYLRIPNDDLLKGFRKRAGLPAPGNDLGGWYTPDIFNAFGQFVSGLARIHAATGDPTCREKANSLLAEWGKCIAKDGYFFYSAKPNALHYFYDKMVGALVNARLYCGNRDALDDLSRITDWAIKHLERSRRLADTSTEWYTLSENLYRAYLVTGDTKYRDFAAVWEYPEYWNRYARKADLGPPPERNGKSFWFHAYSHVNTLGGAGAAYRVKGEARYLEILKNAYDYLQANQVFATGGYGPDEALVPRDVLLAKLHNTKNTFETQCSTWAAFKMVKHLICYTADAKYGDWVERLAINGIGASIPMTAGGQVLYYSNYSPRGGEKRNCNDGWSCCTGTRPQATADYVDLIYFKDGDGLYVNLFAPSTLRWEVGGTQVTVRQLTRFPEAPRTEFLLETERPVEFGLKIRKPQWLSGPMTAQVNGKPADLKTSASDWCGIHRQWKSGDQLTVDLPMRLWDCPLVPGSDYPTAILYGPVVLAARAPDAGFVNKIDLKHLDRSLTPVDGEALTWRLTPDPTVLLRPFYTYKEGEGYYLYLDPAAARYIPHGGAVNYGRHWNVTEPFHFTNVAGATAEVNFEGTGIRWQGLKFDDAGRAEVTIDGKSAGIVDQYGPGRGLPFQWTSGKLKPGKHTLRLILLEEKSKASKDRFINVAGFEILE